MEKIKRARGISLVLMFIMVFQLMMPVNFAFGADDGDITEHVIWNNFILKFLDEGDNEIDSIDLSNVTSGSAISTLIPRNAKIRIDGEFALPDDDPGPPEVQYGFKVNDYFTLEFPESMKFADGEYTINNAGIDLKLIISGTTAKFVITRIAASDISGDIFMDGVIDEEKITDDEGVIVDLVFMGKVIKIGFEDYVAPEILVTLEKSGEFVYDWDLDGGGSADGILWTIEVTTDTPTDGIRIEDDFGDNQEFVLGSLKVDDTFVPVDDYEIIGTVLKYEFDGEISGKYTITYLTKPKLDAFDGVEDKNNKTVTFSNDAKVFLDDEEKDDDSDDVTLNSIKKDGELVDIDIPGRRIKWQITINNYNLKGQSPYIEDIIPENLKLLEAAPYEVSISYDGAESVPIAYTLNPGNRELRVNLTDDFQTAVLTYYTDIDDPDANANENSFSFTNEAYLKWADAGNGSSDGATVGIGGAMISKDASFTGLYVKGANENIKWTVVLNSNRINVLAGAVFKDVIPVGLEFLPETFEVSGITGAVAEVVESSTGTAIKFTFIENFSNVRTITYETKILDDYVPIFTNGGDTGKTSFTNNASFFALGKRHEADDNQEINSNVIKKSNGSYDYDTGILTWRIVVNESEITLNNAVLTDVIGDGMEFISESFKVNGYKVDPDPISGKTITYNFPAGTNDTFEIEFQVMVDKDYLKETNPNGKVTFNNTAILTDSGKTTQSSDKVDIDNKVIEKGMEISEDKDYINWEVPINASKLTLMNIEIWDDIQEELELDINTVRLFEATVDPATGELSKKGETPLVLKDLEDWDDSSETLEFYKGTEGNRLTIKIKGTISEPYILEFTTDVVVTRSFNLSNKIEFSGSGVSAHDTEGESNFRISEAGGNVSSGTGKLTVRKVDADSFELIVDSDTTFEIYRIFAGNEVLIVDGQKEFSTTNGEVILNELLYKKHFIKEVTAPEGYLKDATPHEVWITKDVPEVTYDFKNKKAEADIVFTKQNNFGKNLSGAEFTLYESNKTTEAAGPVSSGSNGEVKFTNIVPGTYYIKETGTPTGYKPLLDFIKVTVSIINDGKEMGVEFETEGINQSYVVTNVLIDDEVMVIKADTFGEGLEGAIFGLYNKDTNDIIKETTSGENGIVLFEGIEEGEYYIKEISPPDGYTKSTDVVSVRVEEDSNDSKKLIVSYKKGDQPYSSEPLEFVNEPIDIEFTKHDNNGNPLSGAEFTLYEGNGTTVFEDRNPVTSDDDGKVVFTVIPVGKYVIKETKAPSGYRDFNGAIEVEVKVEDEGTVATVTFTEKDKSDSGEIEIGEDGTLVVTNERRPSPPGPPTPIPVFGNIAVKKTDEDSNVLSGAEFTLYDEDGRVVERGVTGSDGTLSFEDLEPGSYTLKETKAPEGYVLEVDEKGVTVSANRTNTYTFTNKKAEPEKPGRIEIVKVDEEGRLLSEAWFSLIDSNGTTLENVVTVNGRAAFEDVPVGRYTIKEVQAPEGYVLTEQEVNVTVDSEETVTVRFVNKQSGTTVVPVSGRIIINKVDENNMALAGAEFTLYNENNEIVGTAVSDASGRVIFENLKDGRYFVRETEAPAGYRLVSDSLTVNVTGGSSHSYRFKNVPDTEDIDDPEIPLGWEEIDDPDVPRDVLELPDTGSLLNTWLMITIGLMLIFAGMFLFRTKLTNN
ncbi:SpaA isopeptide-forming pilin-related protein [Sedimentibacter sp.]|uniref:SpaA isopeptide-forming pilin-related protein n=1 Tax=Sedimentibacter sp. TaxID=1960295 RepID=UPI0028AFB89F|nr:SpaA isopeptide-forming pilin-related protein [Sedimentibacter sp.]